MLDWFLDRQLYIAAIVGSACVLAVFAIDFRGVASVIVLLFSLGLIYMGGRLFGRDTTENWLDLSYRRMIKNAFGGALILLGWVLFLRGARSGDCGDFAAGRLGPGPRGEYFEH